MSGLSSGGVSSGGPAIDAEAVLRLLSDPEALKANIAEFNKTKAAADAAVALVGKVKDIESLRSQAATDRETATGILAKASADAAAMIKKAETEAEIAMDAATARVTDAKAFADRANADAALARAEADKAQKEAAAIIKAAKAEASGLKSDAADILAAANSAKAEAATLMEEAMDAKARYEKRLKKLQAATADD